LPTPAFLRQRVEGRIKEKIYKFKLFLVKKTVLDARVTIHQFFHRNTSLQPAETVKKPVSMKVAVPPRVKNNFSIFIFSSFFIPRGRVQRSS
jgi:hypothetical protein